MLRRKLSIPGLSALVLATAGAWIISSLLTDVINGFITRWMR